MSFLQKLAARNADCCGVRPLTLVALGDSVTHGCFDTFAREDGRWDCVYDDQAVYHARLRRRLSVLFPTAALSVVNAGVSGDSSGGGLARLERDVLSYSPDLVTVCFGLNDAMQGEAGLEDYRRNLTRIAAALTERGVPAVFITPNMFATETDPLLSDPAMRETAARAAALQNGGVMDRYMEALRQVCRQAEVPVCDFYRVWKTVETAGGDVTRLLANRINHPVRELHDLLAGMLAEGILREEY